MKKRKQSSQKTADLRLTFSLRWKRLNWERTDKPARRWLYSRQDNLVSQTFPASVSFEDVLVTICRDADEPIRIDRLSPQLRGRIGVRGKTVFRPFFDVVDQIARNHENMYWWIAGNGLSMDTILPTSLPEDFDQVAGRLVFEMRQRFPNRSRLSREQYSEIATRLDELKRFKPREVLSKSRGKELADWNQKYGQRAILSFSKAIDAKQPSWIRREILKTFYRATEKFRR